jgi:hypothetical protein
MPRVDFSGTRPKPWLDGNQVHALFNQDKVWVDRDNETHFIEEIPTDYLENIIPFVTRNYWRFRVGVMTMGFIEMPWMGVSEMFDPDILPANIEDTPLFKALTGELKHREDERNYYGHGPVVV